MSVALILGQRQTAYDPADLIRLHAEQPRLQAAYAQAATATGYDLEKILHNRGERESERRAVASVGLAAAMIGLHDVLLDRGIEPVAIGGMSLGFMVSCALAGSIDRDDLYRLLADAELGDEADPAARAQGCVGAVVPVDRDFESLYGDHGDDVWVAADFGMHESGAFRMLLLAGYRDALDAVAARVPEGYVLVSDEILAPHCPLRAHVAELLARRLETLTITDPSVRLASCLEQGLLRTSAEVIDALVRNIVAPVHLDYLTGEMVAHGARHGIVLGPTLPKVFEFPFPVDYLDSPESLDRLGALAPTAGASL